MPFHYCPRCYSEKKKNESPFYSCLAMQKYKFEHERTDKVTLNQHSNPLVHTKICVHVLSSQKKDVRAVFEIQSFLTVR